MLVGFVVSVSFGASARRQVLSDKEAVVLVSATSVKASPEASSKDLFVLHEGTKVEVMDSYGQWSEIRIADGNEGWILTSALEII
jgi:SH3-like domain-containing protein